MQRKEMVLQGAKQLRVAENTIETAFCDVADLASQLGRMRLNANMSAVVGQDVIDELAQTMAILAQARGSIIKVHGHLNEVKNHMGCATVAVGQEEDKRPKGQLHAIKEHRAA